MKVACYLNSATFSQGLLHGCLALPHALSNCVSSIDGNVSREGSLCCRTLQMAHWFRYQCSHLGRRIRSGICHKRSTVLIFQFCKFTRACFINRFGLKLCTFA